MVLESRGEAVRGRGVWFFLVLELFLFCFKTEFGVVVELFLYCLAYTPVLEVGLHRHSRSVRPSSCLSFCLSVCLQEIEEAKEVNHPDSRFLTR